MKKYLLGLLLLVPSLGWSDDGHTIVQKDRRFSAGEVNIRRGDSLVFTNNDEFIHQIYSSQFDSDERSPGQTLTETFTQAGTFEVHCHIHPKMKLVVHVS
jgi:plastocyanin